MTTRPELSGNAVFHVEQASSTNDLAFQRLTRQPMCLVWTTDQTAGRGSRGRSWLTPPGKGLAVSIGLRAGAGMHPAEFCYPLFAGVLLIELLNRLWPDHAFRLKWPNDVMLNGRKLAGILCESRIGQGLPHVVLGLGVNLYHHPALAQLPKPVTALDACGVEPDARRLVAELWRQLPLALTRFRDSDLLRRTWLSHCNFEVGERLRLQAEGRILEGAFTGLGDDGALLIRSIDGSLTTIRQTCLDFAILPSGG